MGKLIMNGVEYTGGDYSESVSVTQIQSTGTKIATIAVNDVETDIYAPNAGASALNDLSDVTTSSPSNGQVLKYNSSSSKWVNANENTYSDFVGSTHGLVPGVSTQANKFLKDDGTWAVPIDTTYNDFNGNSHGLVPAPASGDSGKFLKGDGSWDIPQDTTYNDFAGSVHGLVPAVSTQAGKYLKDDGSWDEPEGTTVEANPSGTATDELEKLQVGDTVYSLPSDEVVTHLMRDDNYNKWVEKYNYSDSKMGISTQLYGSTVNFIFRCDSTIDPSTDNIHLEEASPEPIPKTARRLRVGFTTETCYDTSPQIVIGLKSTFNSSYNSYENYSDQDWIYRWTCDQVNRTFELEFEILPSTPLYFYFIANGWNLTLNYVDIVEYGSGTPDLEELGDVSLSSPSNGQVLTYNSTTSKWVNANASGGGGATTLNDLTDVTTSSPSNNQVLTYNSTTSKWENKTPTAGTINHTEVSSGSYEIALSNSSSGDIKKTADLEIRVNDNTYGTMLKLHSPHTTDSEPWIVVMKSHAANTYYDAVSIYQNDITIEGDSEEYGSGYLTWDGVNHSLRTALSTISLTGTTDPSGNIGREGSVYYKTSGGNVVGIFFKVNGVWIPYVPTSPTPPSEWLYNWDFTQSLVDSVQSATIEMKQAQDIQRTSNGIECTNTGNDWIIKLPVDLLSPNKQVEIDFAENSEWDYNFMNWIVKYRSDDYSTPDDTGVYVYTDETNEVIASCHYHLEQAGNDTSPLYQNFFTNSTLKIVTRMSDTSPSVLVWDIYKDNTLLLSTPTSISELDNYYFWQFDDGEYPCNDPYWCVSGEYASNVIISGLRIKNVVAS